MENLTAKEKIQLILEEIVRIENGITIPNVKFGLAQANDFANLKISNILKYSFDGIDEHNVVKILEISNDFTCEIFSILTNNDYIENDLELLKRILNRLKDINDCLSLLLFLRDFTPDTYNDALKLLEYVIVEYYMSDLVDID